MKVDTILNLNLFILFLSTIFVLVQVLEQPTRLLSQEVQGWKIFRYAKHFQEGAGKMITDK